MAALLPYLPTGVSVCGVPLHGSRQSIVPSLGLVTDFVPSSKQLAGSDCALFMFDSINDTPSDALRRVPVVHPVS
jgi:hypothetical protein